MMESFVMLQQEVGVLERNMPGVFSKPDHTMLVTFLAPPFLKRSVNVFSLSVC
jgi:hypothetical protein